MTLVAGVFPRTNDVVPPELLEDHIARELSRNSAHPVQVFRHRGSVLAKVDIGAFLSSGHQTDADGAISLLCGEPLLSGFEKPGSESLRATDLGFLHQRLVENDIRALSRCDGAFSLVHLAAGGARLLLATDHLGVRPLYYSITPTLVVFSSVFRLLERLPGLRRTLDVRGVMEHATLGYCLGNRTPISEIKRLGPAEVLSTYRNGDIAVEKYFSWERDIAVYEKEAEVSERTAYELFERAVTRRLRSDKSAIAFLSGGLDSRCIVSVLRSKGVPVRTYNFPVPGEQDEIFASRFAEAAGTEHHVIARREPMSLREGSWSFLLSDELGRSGVAGDLARPKLVWSGDGGSVGVGAVYIDDNTNTHLERNEIMKAVGANAPPAIPLGVVAHTLKASVRPVSDSMFEEIERIAIDDPVRRFHLFLMFNDQHRHMDRHFEQIDLHGLEFHLPFFDATFLKEILRVPIRRLRNHRFYHDWMKQFPASAQRVPWQTYPGHLPCPVISDAPSAAPQWEDRDSEVQRVVKNSGRRIRLKRAVEMLSSPAFPRELLSRPRLFAVALIHSLGLRDYAYVLDFAYDVFRFSRNATVGPKRLAEYENRNGPL